MNKQELFNSCNVPTTMSEIPSIKENENLSSKTPQNDDHDGSQDGSQDGSHDSSLNDKLANSNDGLYNYDPYYNPYNPLGIYNAYYPLFNEFITYMIITINGEIITQIKI